MPWSCKICQTLVRLDDTASCPNCGGLKSAWSLFGDQTRTLVLASRTKLAALRGTSFIPPGGSGPPQFAAWHLTDRAAVMPKARALELMQQNLLPDASDLICMRMSPAKSLKKWELTLSVKFAQAKTEDLSYTFEPSRDDLNAAGYFSANFLCVHGAEQDPIAFPFVQVLDVSEATPLGHAPLLEASGFRSEPIPIVLETTDKPTPVVSTLKQIELLEVEDANFRMDSCVVMPGGVEPEGAGADPADDVGRSVSVFATSLRYMAEQPEKRLLVAGHTDTTGTIDFNQPLSEERAATSHAVLLGDRETFADLAQKRHKVADYQQILTWVHEQFGWDCDPQGVDGEHGPNTSTAIKGFQQAYNENSFAGNPSGAPLVEDGVLGGETWGGLFDAYQLGLRAELGEDVDGLAGIRAGIAPVEQSLPTVGCSEHHPIDELKKEEFKSEANRRVEILLFDPGEEEPLECHLGGSCQPALCPIYDATRYERIHLPLMVSAKKWTARWEGEAKSGRMATMVLDAPGLPAGTPLRFEVRQTGAGLLTTLEVASDADACSVPFGDWALAQQLGEARVLEPGENFPLVQFSFEVQGGGRKVASEELTFSDSLDARLIDDANVPIALEPMVVRSPWGAKLISTDAEGFLRLEGLPPGGVRVVREGQVVPK